MNKKKIVLILLVICLFIFILGTDRKQKDDNVLYIQHFLDDNDYENILSLDKDKKNFIFASRTNEV